MVARDMARLKSVEQEILPFNIKAEIRRGDISNRPDVKNIFRQVTNQSLGVDILICNAGVYFRKPVTSQTIDDIRNIMEINFFGSLNCIYEILPHFLQKKSGHIIIVSSVDGKKGLPLDSAYSSSKFALAGFADVLRQELAPSGIHICTVFPGRIDTPMIRDIKTSGLSAKISPDNVAKAIISSIIRRKKEVFIPYLTSKFFVVTNCVSCGLGDWGVRYFNLKGKDLPERAPPPAPIE